MNPSKLMLVVAAVVGAGAALAQSPQSKTRAEVRAEAIAANQAGQIRVGDMAVLHDQLSSMSSQRSRAEVQAEAAAANQARAGIVTHEGSLLPDDQLSTSSTLSRTQVRAEAIEAQRLRLIVNGDTGQRLPTPAELESVRQAGLRAVDMKNVARR